MKTATEWFAEYGESHQNPTNKLIHWICVPAILFSVLGLLWSIPVPSPIPLLNVATLVGGLALLFYFRLSPMLGLGMLVILVLLFGLIELIESTGANVAWVSLGVFVAAWLGQFYGHQIEGKKPSFFKDVQFLLIGPIWLLNFVYERFGIKA
jgi:uncharacterized membrane protein YGL010W